MGGDKRRIEWDFGGGGAGRVVPAVFGAVREPDTLTQP